MQNELLVISNLTWLDRFAKPAGLTVYTPPLSCFLFFVTSTSIVNRPMRLVGFWVSFFSWGLLAASFFCLNVYCCLYCCASPFWFFTGKPPFDSIRKGRVYKWLLGDDMDPSTFMLRKFHPSFCFQLASLSVEFEYSQAVRTSTISFFLQSILHGHFKTCNEVPFFISVVRSYQGNFKFKVSWLCDGHIAAGTFVVKGFRQRATTAPSPRCRGT
jgi:hypothetical protein